MIRPSEATASVNFFVNDVEKQLCRRTMHHVPRVGDICVFSDVRYGVLRVEWCMDEDATAFGVRVNVELHVSKEPHTKRLR